MQEKTDLEDDFSRERDMMAQSVRELTIQLKAKCALIDWFIPTSEVQKIEERMVWSEMEDRWYIPKPELTGNNLRKDRPSSAYGMKRPTTEHARVTKAMGNHDPRYIHENILQMDLDMPERTTED